MVNRMIFNQTGFFGRGASPRNSRGCESRGFTKAMIVTDPILADPANGTAKKVTDVLDAAGIGYEIFTNVKPNPPVECIQDGVEKFKASGADFLIGLGGGSRRIRARALALWWQTRVFPTFCHSRAPRIPRIRRFRSLAFPQPLAPRQKPRSTMSSPIRRTSESL